MSIANKNKGLPVLFIASMEKWVFVLFKINITAQVRGPTIYYYKLAKLALECGNFSV
jgi:hypothetical protein